ncbi:toprim domain-containing protein [Thiomicrorhabdus hydrogeniphila]
MACYDVNIVKQTASQHGWLDILKTIAPTLEDATKKPGQHVPCPVNGGTDGFRLFKDAPISGAGYSNKEGAFGDGFAVLQFATGLPFKEVLTLVANFLGLTEETVKYIKPKPVMQPTAFELSQREVLSRKGKLNLLWGQSSTVKTDDRTVQYLRSRGIKGSWMVNHPSIRLHPNAWYRDGNGNQASAPAMVLKFTDSNGTPCNIHKTFLSTKHTGKNELMDDPKLQMKPSCRMSGGAVRLGGIQDVIANNGVLHVSEGFENAASVIDVHGQPCWPTLNWALLQGFIPPQEVKTLYVWADNDPLDERGNNAGVKAANKLRDKLANLRPDIKVFLKIPPNKKEDWNDLYVAGRLDLFSLES